MALKMELETLDGLADNLKPLYTQKGEKFVLDLDGPVNTDDQNKDKIPLSRLNQEIEKRKASEAQLKELADQLIEDVPEDKRSIIPKFDSPAKTTAWLRTAFKMGFFTDKETPPIDPKRPNDKLPTDQTMNPVQRMATGYKK